MSDFPPPRVGRHGETLIPSAWQLLARNVKGTDSQAAQVLARLVLEASEPFETNTSLRSSRNAGGAAPAPPAPPSNESDER